MKRNLSFLFLLLFFFPTLSFSQKDYSFIKKEVTAHEISMTEYENDPDAEALITHDAGEYYFRGNDIENQFWLYKKRYVKIKILKEGGLKYATFEIPLDRKSVV